VDTRPTAYRNRISQAVGAFILLALLVFGPATQSAAQLLDDIVDARVSMEKVVTTPMGKATFVETQTDPVSFEYNGVAFSARTNAGVVEGWARFLTDVGWTEWIEMHIVYSATGGTVMGGVRGDAVRSGPYALRFSIDSEMTFSVTGTGVFDTRKDVDGQPAPHSDSEETSRSFGELAVDPPPLITRTEWSADPFIGTPVPLADPSYNYMTFHHAAGFSATSREDGLAQVKAIQDLHQNVRGWSDIGYQFVIDRGGRIYQGRPFLDGSTSLGELPRLAMGAHVGGANTGNIGICLLGCYHPSEGSFCTETITTEAYDTYVQTFAFLSENYGMDPALIRGHRDFSSTACPGDNNYALLCSGPMRDASCAGPQLRVDVQNLISTGIVRPDDLTLSQNFPNPFAEATTIDYYLKSDGVVTLKVYDSVGREVDTLADGFQDGERWYNVTFDGGNVAAGTYFLRLEVLGIGNKKSSRATTMTVAR
jgi:hypothetical protein